MPVETSIMEALFARLAEMPGVLPIAWPNKPFDPPSDGKFLRVQFIPNLNERRFVGSRAPHRMRGLMQVSVLWPQGHGEGPPRTFAGNVATRFETDLRLPRDGVSVRVTKRPELADLLVDGSRVMIPVTITWEAWA